MNDDQRKNAVLVAQDVLLQLGRTDVRLNIKRGRYLLLHQDDHKHIVEKIGFVQDLRDCVDEVQEKCQVCARGALVLSKARLLDNVPMESIGSPMGVISLNNEDTTRILEEIWGVSQLEMIEAAFEVSPYLSRLNYPDLCELNGAVIFGSKYPEPELRLAAIMENIIENGGAFTVEKATLRQAIDCRYDFYGDDKNS